MKSAWAEQEHFLPCGSVRRIYDELSMLRGSIGAEEKPAEVIRTYVECVQAGPWGDKETTEFLSELELLPEIWRSDPGVEKQAIMYDAVLRSWGPSDDVQIGLS